MKKRWIALTLAALLAVTALAGCGGAPAGETGEVEITNVSYDPTRELYQEFNAMFEDYWQAQTGQSVTVVQSHGGSGSQALQVANGLPADVVTLALEGDVQAVADAGLIDEGFTAEFGQDSAPYTSTIVFLVRAGNPKNIQDWDDLLRDEVEIITPNPKTSGGACWNYLAAWYYFEQQGLPEADILANLKTIYQHVLVLDSGARGATTSFVENGQGDVLIAWENEAFLSLEEYPGEYEIVIPSVSILCQPTVAVVDEVVDTRGTRDVATAYLEYLYSEDAQHIEAMHYYRPSNPAVYADYVSDGDSRVITEVPQNSRWIVDTVELTDIGHFGGWAEAKARHFADGGLFDSIYEGGAQ